MNGDDGNIGQVMHMIGKLEGKLDSYLSAQSEHNADHIHLESRIRAVETAQATAIAKSAGLSAGGKLFWTVAIGLVAMAAGVSTVIGNVVTR